MWLASPVAIEKRLAEVYPPATARKPASVMRNLEAISGEPVVRLVDRVVDAGIEQRASDIHLEPEEDGIAVRYRVDGILRHVMLLPRAVGIPLVSRIKIMAGMDIAARLRPQGGHASVGMGEARIDLRVSTLPASYGEKVVIRILDPRVTIHSLDSLGLDDVDAARMRRMLEAREGLILVTGPTGSGKTTTLYAALRQIQQRGLNIITVEDPVEYRIAGIVQVQINEKAGSRSLRRCARFSARIGRLLIGEIRDARLRRLRSSLTDRAPRLCHITHHDASARSRGLPTSESITQNLPQLSGVSSLSVSFEGCATNAGSWPMMEFPCSCVRACPKTSWFTRRWDAMHAR